MKRTLALIAALALLVLALAGCGEKKNNKKDDGASGTQSGVNGGAVKDDALDRTDDGSAGVTGDGILDDDDTGTVQGRSFAANAAGSRRSITGDKTITHENGNLYGKTYLTPETEKSANAQLRSNGRSLTGIPNDVLYGDDLRYQQMLSNGRVHDTDGFLLDGENTHYNTLR